MNNKEFMELHHMLGVLVSDYIAKLSIAIHQLQTLPFLGREQLSAWFLIVSGVTRCVQTETELFQKDVERRLTGIRSGIKGITYNNNNEKNSMERSLEIEDEDFADLLEGIKIETPKNNADVCSLKTEEQLEEVGVHDNVVAAATIKTTFLDVEDFLNRVSPESDNNTKSGRGREIIRPLSEVDHERNVSDESVAEFKVDVQSNAVIFGNNGSICNNDSSFEEFRGFPQQPVSEDDYVSEILRRINDTGTDLLSTTESICVRTVESYSEIDVQSMLGERRVLRCYVNRMNRVQIEKWTSKKRPRRRRGKGWSRK